MLITGVRSLALKRRIAIPVFEHICYLVGTEYGLWHAQGPGQLRQTLCSRNLI